MRTFYYLLFVVTLLSACAKNSVDDSTSRFMLLHASPNTPAAEYFIDDKPILLQPLLFNSNTFYRDILSGVRNFKIVISGNTIVDTNLNFDQGAVRSFILYDKPIQVKLKIIDDNLLPPVTGQCRVRFIQLIPDLGRLDVMNSKNNEVIISNADLGDVQDWQSIEAGIYNFQLRESSSQGIIYTDWRPDTLLPGQNYTIMSTGYWQTQTTDTMEVWIVNHNNF